MADPLNPAETVPQKSSKGKKPAWRTWLIFAAVLAGIYFGNTAVQTYLGKQALAQTGLELIDMNEALARARTENKLVLADMSAIWCPSCRKLDKQVLSNPAVKAAIARGYVFTRVEYESDEGRAFAKRYQVDGFPTLLVLDPQGELLRKLPLTFDPQHFISLLSS